jgi:hypothetical protein
MDKDFIVEQLIEAAEQLEDCEARDIILAVITAIKES